MKKIVMALVGMMSSTALATTDVNINRADVAQLSAIDGVDAALAADIVKLRADRGRLSSVEALRVLPGASKEALASLRRNTVVDVEFPLAKERSYATVAEVLEVYADEPSIQDFQQWVMVYSKTNLESLDQWLRESKRFAMLPELALEYKYRDGWDQDWEYYPADGIVDSTDEAVFDVLSDSGRDTDSYYVVKAKWRLDELIMSSERVRVINEAQDIVKLRDKVLGEATKVYFDRRQHQVDQLLSPATDLQARVKAHLRLMEYTAELDALSGGAFSAALAGRP